MAAPVRRRRSTPARLLVSLAGVATVALQVVAIPPAAAATLTVDSPSVGEPGDIGASNELVFTVTRTPGAAMTVDYQTADGTATAGSDYLATDGTLAFGAAETQKQLRITVLGDNLDEGNETLTLHLTGASDGSPDVDGTGTIVDDADPVPGISVANTAVQEGNAGSIGAGFVVSLSNPSGRTVTVHYATADGTASLADYANTNGTLSIPAGRLSAVVSVPVNGDTISEDDETFTLTLSGAVNATLADDSATGTIIDDDNLPSLSVDDVVTPNEKGPAHFTVTLSPASGRPVEVDVTAGGGSLPSATAGADFNQPASRHLVFAPGVTSLGVDVPVVDDAVDEPAEHFTLTLTNPSHATLSKAIGAGTITDDDPGPSLSIGDVSKVEGTAVPPTTTFTFPVTLAGAGTTQTVTVGYDIKPGTATTPSDYTATSLTGTLTFLPGVTSRDVIVSVNADTLAEAAETFTVVLHDPSAGVTLADDTATGTILNDDGPPAKVSVDDPTVTEGAGGHFTVSLERAVPDVVSVTYVVRDGSATGGDYSTPASGIVTFAPNTTGSKSIDFTTTQDSTYEGNETFTVELANPINAVIDKGTGTATITNDDTAPLVSIQPTQAVAEGNTGDAKATLDVTLSSASGLPASVNFTSADGTATNGADYTVDANGTLTFAPGETTKKIALSAVGDTLFEANETFTVTLASPSGATLGGALATVTITNDDAAPVVHIEAPLSPVVEPATAGAQAPASFAVKLDRISGLAVTVKYSTAGGTATSGSDFVAASNVTVTIPSGAQAGTAVVQVRGDGDQNEPDETFTATISNPGQATIDTSRATATGTIKDNTPGGTPKVTVLTPALTVKEGDSGTATTTVSLSLTPAQAGPVTVDYNTANGTASAPADYPAIGRTTVTFAAGETAKSIAVAVQGDTSDEADETFTVGLISDGTSPSAGAQVAAGQGTATVTIRDDDGPVASVDPVSVIEGNSGTGPAVFTVSLSAPSPQAITVAYGTSDGTATSPSDYTATSGAVFFNPGERTKTLTVAIAGDTSDEADEDFSVRLSNPVNATLGRSLASGIILDDDQPTVLVVASAPAPAPTVREGDDGVTPVTFTLALNAPTTRESALDFSTVDGTGHAGADYLAVSGRLTFAPGETTKTVVVPVVGDVRKEVDERFSLRLSNPANVTISGDGTGTILDDDRPGYSLVALDGGLFAFGNAGFYGSTGNTTLNQPIVGSAMTPSGRGYWLVASDGGIFAFGDARFFGSTGAIRLVKPIMGMAATPSGQGYWLVASDGGIFAFGDARFFGSTGALRLAKPIVAMAATPSGLGYWLVASDGGIFAYGDARFLGSTGAIVLNKPIVGMAASATGAGYTLVATDGGIFTFGDAPFLGSTGAMTLNKPVVGLMFL